MTHEHLNDFIKKIIKENEELERRLEMAKGVIRTQFNRICELEDENFELDKEVTNTEEMLEFVKGNYRILKNSEEIYKENFNSCLKKYHNAQDDNDKLRLLLSRYFQRYGELK